MGREKKEGVFIPEWLLPDAQLFTTTEHESVFTEDILVLWYTVISSILNQYILNQYISSILNQYILKQYISSIPKGTVYRYMHSQ